MLVIQFYVYVCVWYVVITTDGNCILISLKPGFHYPSWRPELTARVDGWPVSITRRLGPLTLAVDSGSGNRA